MKLLDVLGSLAGIEPPVFSTRDVAASLEVSPAHASTVLRRLAGAGRIICLRRGVWAFRDRLDPLAVPEHLTFPFPAYVSLQSALYLHGMISQVPSVTYAVSLARTRRWTTPVGTVSIHHVEPWFFFGFEDAGRRGGRLATPEKALVDVLYLRPARSGLFRSLPELTWPGTFNVRVARSMIARIRSTRRRTLASRAFEELLTRRV